MTSFINMEQNRDFRVKKKSTMLFYSFIAGFTGLPFFYLHAIKKGIICLLLNLAYFGMSFVLFYLVLKVEPAIIVIILNIIIIPVAQDPAYHEPGKANPHRGNESQHKR